MEAKQDESSVERNKWMPWAQWKAPKEYAGDEVEWCYTLWMNDRGSTCQLIRCRNLRGLDKGGTSDPYVKVWGPKDDKKPLFTSKTVKKNCDPEFKEEFKVPLSPRKLRVEVWDWNRLSKDTKLGESEIDFFLDEEFDKNDYPTLGAEYVVSRSLGQGNGSVELKFVPHFEPNNKHLLREAAEAISTMGGEMFQQHEISIPQGTIRFRVPKELQPQDHIPAVDGLAFFKTPEPKDKYEINSWYEILVRTKGTDDDGRFVDPQFLLDYVKSVAKIVSVIQTKEGMPTKSLDIEGTARHCGLNVGWYTLYTDYTSRDPQNPYSAVTTAFMFSLQSTIIELAITTHYMTGEDIALHSHRLQFGYKWAAVMESLDVRPA